VTADNFLQFASALSAPLFLLTAQGQILAANPAASKLLGIDGKLLAERKLQELVVPEQVQKLTQHLRNWSASHQALPATLKLRQGNGEYLEYHCQGSLLQPRTEENPALIVLYGKKTSNMTVGFISLNGKIAQLEKEITERRQFEQALAESEAQVRLLLDSTGDAIYGIDMQGECTFVNATCRHLLGYDTSDELLGKNMHELIHHTHVDGSPYPAKSCQIYQAYITGQHVKVDDEVFWRKDGSAFPAEYFSHPIWREGKIIGAVITFRDITEHKAIEGALERAQAIAHIGSWEWDLVTNEVAQSDETKRIFLGDNFHEYDDDFESMMVRIHPDDQDMVDELLSQTMTKQSKTHCMEYRIVQPDGSERIIISRGEVDWNDANEPVRMIGTVQDVTEQKWAEEEIRKLNEELEERVEIRTGELRLVNEDLQSSLQQLKKTQEQLVQSEKMASLGGLVAGVAHEINTPVGVGVTAISHLQMKVEEYAALYHSGQLTRDDFESLLKSTTESSKIIHNNLDRAAELIRSFKQVAVDQTSNELRNFNLKGYLDEILQSLKPKLKNGAYEVTISCPEGISLYNHPGALSQVMTNLMMNSIIHGFEDCESGAINIKVSEKSDGTVHLDYSDNGKGISAENVKRIFEPFFTTRRGQGGSGLGMHIVFNLVTQTLGGQIHCSSIEGQGALFQIELPGAVKQPVLAEPMQNLG